MIKVFNSYNLNRDDVINLWMSSFGDTREYIEFFLDNCPDYLCVEYLIEDKPVSMLFLLNGRLSNGKSKYLYAACTDSEFRRRGLMEALIDFVKIHCKDNGYSGIFLVPANEKLYSYYSKFGFLPSFNKKSLCVKSMDVYSERFNTSDINRILEAKKKLLLKIDGFSFDDDVMKYTIEEHIFNGGFVFLKQIEAETILIFYYFDGKDIVIKELLTDFSDISCIFKEHFGNKSSENIYICAPLVYNSRDIVEKYTKCGMYFPLDEKTSDFLLDHTALYAGMYLD
ncbi:MAG: GNAT family N-acetyltransferase [Clostridia bacterium]|nr:GNAT family N-acetyltransferase [Clostridia bacterium]